MHRTFRVFHPEPIGPSDRAVWLSAEAAHHLKHVLRLAEGTEIELFDGHFLGVYPAILSYQRYGRKIKATFTRPPVPDPPLRTQPFQLGQAQIKREGWHQILQHGTELGVTEFIPIRSQYSQMHIPPSAQLAAQKVIYGACEQCGRNQLPSVAVARTLESWVSEDFEGIQLYCTLNGGISVDELTCPLELPIRLLVGPEGGLTNTEEQLLKGDGWIGLSLGSYTLRATTASLVAIALLQQARRLRQ